MSIGKIVQTVVKHVGVDDIAQSKVVKDMACDAAGDLGEALAKGITRESADVASTVVEAQAKKSGGFFSRIWNKIFHSSKTQTVSSTSVHKTSTQATAEDLQEQIAKYQKQIKKLKKENKGLKTSIKSTTKENSKFKGMINAFKDNTTEQQQKQVDVDCMSWIQKLFSSKCKFNWDNFKWEAC